MIKYVIVGQDCGAFDVIYAPKIVAYMDQTPHCNRVAPGRGTVSAHTRIRNLQIGPKMFPETQKQG